MDHLDYFHHLTGRQLEGGSTRRSEHPRVTQQPKPVSPSYRNRVPEPEHTNRSRHVHYEPEQHISSALASEWQRVQKITRATPEGGSDLVFPWQPERDSFRTLSGWV